MSEEQLENTPTKVKKEKKPKSKARKIIEWVLTGIFAGLFAFFAIGQVMGMVNRNKNYTQTLTYDYGTFVITTDSMEPEYKVGTAIITHKDSAKSIADNFKAGKVMDVSFVAMYPSNNHKYDYPEYHPGDLTYGGIDYKFSINPNPTYPSNGYTVITHRIVDLYEDTSRAVGKGRYTFVAAGINTGGELSKEGQYQLLTENEILGIVKVNSPVLGGTFRFMTTPWGLLVFLLIPAFYLVITSVIDIFKAIKEPEEEGASSGDNGSGSSESGSPLEGLSDEDRERLKKEMLDELLNGKKGDK